MNRNDSRPVLKTSGAGDSLAEFNYAARVLGGDSSLKTLDRNQNPRLYQAPVK